MPSAGRRSLELEGELPLPVLQQGTDIYNKMDWIFTFFMKS